MTLLNMAILVFVQINCSTSRMIFLRARIASLLTFSFQVCSNELNSKEFSVFLRNLCIPAADIKPDEKLAVMFWIHGGAWWDWSGNDHLFGADFFIEQRVIVVTINYRLGIFGFLSFGTPEYSGNMGLKDQQLALKWVYENIERFSGDKERITIFGESAGNK